MSIEYKLTWEPVGPFLPAATLKEEILKLQSYKEVAATYADLAFKYTDLQTVPDEAFAIWCYMDHVLIAFITGDRGRREKFLLDLTRIATSHQYRVHLDEP